MKTSKQDDLGRTLKIGDIVAKVYFASNANFRYGIVVKETAKQVSIVELRAPEFELFYYVFTNGEKHYCTDTKSVRPDTILIINEVALNLNPTLDRLGLVGEIERLEALQNP